jgi:Cu/Ag efflux protein CusF
VPAFAFVFMLAWALAGCGGPATRADVRSPEGAKRYALQGQVVRLEESGKVVVIRHQKIDGWMDAMTMAFPLGDPRESSSLHAGDRVTATVFVKGDDFWIGNVHREF